MPAHITSQEDYGLVRSKIAASADSKDIVRAVIGMINDNTLTSPITTPLRRKHDWRRVAQQGSGAVVWIWLERTSSTASHGDQQQILIRSETDNIKIGYSPNGAITWVYPTTGIPALDPAKSWTGMRNITGTSGTWTAPGTRVVMAEYHDASIETGFGASLTLLLENAAGTGFAYGCHVGRIIVPDNNSDYSLLGTPPASISGDALLVGRPDVDHVAGSWVYGNFTHPDDSSCIRVGNLKWSYFRMIPERGQPEPPAVLAGNDQLRAIKGIYKPMPYSVMGHGRAVAYGANVQSDTATDGAGRIGQTKYLRLFYYDLEHRAQVSSIAYDSLQSWLGCTASDVATKRHQVVLWSKASVVVP